MLKIFFIIPESKPTAQDYFFIILLVPNIARQLIAQSCKYPASELHCLTLSSWALAAGLMPA